MRLRELLEGTEITALTISPDTEITHVCADSRRARKGSLFAAVPGTLCDGALYARQAVDRGAACVLCRQEMPGLPCAAVPDVRAALGKIACTWYENPAARLTVLGVTGTNGKTTTTYLLRHILRSAGIKTGLIGTVQNLVEEQMLPARRTTPDALEIQSLLCQMADAGCTHAVMEVSSHALMQHRVEGITFAEGIFTNLTEDHLDYHGTMERYCGAKAKLFHASRGAVCNADDPWTERMLRGVTCPVTRYGLQNPADLWAEGITLQERGVTFAACTARECIPVRLGVPGRFSCSVWLLPFPGRLTGCSFGALFPSCASASARQMQKQRLPAAPCRRRISPRHRPPLCAWACAAQFTEKQCGRGRPPALFCNKLFSLCLVRRSLRALVCMVRCHLHLPPLAAHPKCQRAAQKIAAHGHKLQRHKNAHQKQLAANMKRQRHSQKPHGNNSAAA